MSPYTSFNGAVNDWCYFNRLLSGQCVAERKTTPSFLWALVNEQGKYRWWKLRRRDYKRYKEVESSNMVAV